MQIETRGSINISGGRGSLGNCPLFRANVQSGWYALRKGTKLHMLQLKVSMYSISQSTDTGDVRRSTYYLNDEFLRYIVHSSSWKGSKILWKRNCNDNRCSRTKGSLYFNFANRIRNPIGMESIRFANRVFRARAERLRWNRMALSILTRSFPLYVLIIRGRKFRQDRKESVIIRSEQIDLSTARRRGLLRLFRPAIHVAHIRVPGLL